MNPRLRNFALCASLTIFTGCAQLHQSAKVESTVLVKVPITKVNRTLVSHDGWHFRYVLTAPEADQALWYVAWNNARPLRTNTFTPYWIQINRRTAEIADATKAVLGRYPTMIEPNRTFSRFTPKQAAEAELSKDDADAAGKPRDLEYHKGPKGTWPTVRATSGDGLNFDKSGRPAIDPVWHLRKEYSGLWQARERVGRPAKGVAVRIGHLDNGYDNRHAGLPEGLKREPRGPVFEEWGSLSNAIGRLEWEQWRSRREEAKAKREPFNEIPKHTPHEPGSGEARGSHGLGTMGILAGGKVKIPGRKGVAGYEGYLGGAPHADVVPVRVAPWVMSLNTAELAYAINYASLTRDCDVISMSHGGAPTQTWADAVNAAYERGTAMFAATGDYFSVVGTELPIAPAGLIMPASPVYPAAFRRVVGVTGVTATGGSYGRNWYARLALKPWKLLTWMGRGSYGADGTSVFRPLNRPDREQVAAQGTLRPHPIAAYAPNAPWLLTKKVKGVERTDLVDLDGGGTSSSTPQVAAAAALWLQKNRAEIERRGDWKNWRKAEAVYQALLRSADRSGQGGRPDRFLGAGQLKANRALDFSYDKIVSTRTGDDLRFAQSPLDHTDGRHSVRSFFGLGHLRYPPEAERAYLDQVAVNPNEPRAEALRRLYYNVSLLREWHGGDLPRKSDQARYDKRAKRKAQHAPTPRPAVTVVRPL